MYALELCHIFGVYVIVGIVEEGPVDSLTLSGWVECSKPRSQRGCNVD